MKFAYMDESGSEGEGDVFVMAGLVIDATKLKKWNKIFDDKLQILKDKHDSSPNDFKTKSFLNGNGGWSKIPPDIRKDGIKDICNSVAECSKVIAFGLEFKKFRNQQEGGNISEHLSSYWNAAAMFVVSLLQKKGKKEKNNKGLTVLVFDDNKKDMPKCSNCIYSLDEWFDDLYAEKKKIRGKIQYKVKREDRFDQIIDQAFAIKSEHSPFIQVADILSYIYRRHLELTDSNEAYSGEADYFSGLVAILNKRRYKIGNVPKESSVVEYYKTIKHSSWSI